MEEDYIGISISEGGVVHFFPHRREENSESPTLQAIFCREGHFASKRPRSRNFFQESLVGSFDKNCDGA